eukprot:TRINITY_DN694_c0_g3_i5.p1 TRINITY_DN694_c0_g3~~TRINITY_DN694_c0_g3_i5.p1  ORF type:complete len:104 (-),score=7.53 TRINITY_DN694_c0_g3_i5:265-576(-)
MTVLGNPSKFLSKALPSTNSIRLGGAPCNVFVKVSPTLKKFYGLPLPQLPTSLRILSLGRGFLYEIESVPPSLALLTVSKAYSQNLTHLERPGLVIKKTRDQY